MNKKQESFEYLFLDLEWNQMGGKVDITQDELLQIGAAAFDRDFQQEKRFSRTIAPEHPERITAYTYQTLHVDKSTFLMSDPADKVLREFSRCISRYRKIIVWTRESYDIFRYNMKKYQIPMCRHQVIILQEIVQEIITETCVSVGFERALITAGIEYEYKQLHFSEYDVVCLQLLYQKLREKYDYLCTGDTGCVRSVYSSVLHSPKCRYATVILPSNKRIMKKAAVFDGYLLCQCCKDTDSWRKIQLEKKLGRRKKEKKIVFDEFAITEKNVRRICQAYGMWYSLSNGILFVKTKVAAWRIYFEENQVIRVYHSNSRVSRNQSMKYKKKANEDFHLQPIKEKSILKTLKYIHKHDQRIMEGKYKMDRMELLFQKIERKKKE